MSSGHLIKCFPPGIVEICQIHFPIPLHSHYASILGDMLLMNCLERYCLQVQNGNKRNGQWSPIIRRCGRSGQPSVVSTRPAPVTHPDLYYLGSLSFLSVLYLLIQAGMWLRAVNRPLNAQGNRAAALGIVLVLSFTPIYHALHSFVGAFN